MDSYCELTSVYSYLGVLVGMGLQYEVQWFAKDPWQCGRDCTTSGTVPPDGYYLSGASR